MDSPLSTHAYETVRAKIVELITVAQKKATPATKELGQAYGILMGACMVAWGRWDPKMEITLPDGDGMPTTPTRWFDTLKGEALKITTAKKSKVTLRSPICPECKAPLHFKGISGMMLKRDTGSGYVYDARCVMCHKDFEVPAPAG